MKDEIRENICEMQEYDYFIMTLRRLTYLEIIKMRELSQEPNSKHKD